MGSCRQVLSNACTKRHGPAPEDEVPTILNKLTTSPICTHQSRHRTSQSMPRPLIHNFKKSENYKMMKKKPVSKRRVHKKFTINFRFISSPSSEAEQEYLTLIRTEDPTS
ncbi:hypothetical protein AVEN_104013-1 [Araneus ventricosus]|uniref:Uncharacterized protein n=1 Tax=Araneus ventricosus TaxID=182803 RepID=A0A4Y2Q2B0_ARAVE|nr:hypothetical protein AVEN_104013-1 [Araneus ventricosus]